MTELVVVAAAAPDPAREATEAIAAGASVLVEDPGRLAPDDLRRLAREERAFAALRSRFEPSATAAARAVRSGAIGLVWGASAETVAAGGVSLATAAADLLDALVAVGGLGLESVTALAGDPLAAALRFEHGAVGTLGVVAADGEGGRLRLVGSHGSVEVDLAAPRIAVGGGRSPARRIGPSGAALLLDAFAAGTAPPLARAAELLELLRDDGGGSG